MVDPQDWPEVCKGLLESGVCTLVQKDDVFEGPRGPLLNGLFGVTQDEFHQGVEVYRLIMNLIPLNHLCEGLSGDIATLPSWAMMSPFFLQPGEKLLISSEDVRCFFYTMAVPECWHKFLCFNRLVPDEVLPERLRGQATFLASRVLPMGFLNSVSLAQHVHRNLALRAGARYPGAMLCEGELRKDRPFTIANPSWRIYLDNFDLLEKIKATEMVGLEGSLAPSILALRAEYEVWEVPINKKKSVNRQLKAEVQGAMVDGELGTAYPREGKLAKYVSAAFTVAKQEAVTQRQMQVLCGGLVYLSMFRRPLLGLLNAVWRFIESFEEHSRKVLPIPKEVRLEIVRFCCLVPLARIDFKLDMHPQVTCSDASTTGDIALVDSSMVQGWAVSFSQASVVIIGAGPPCQGVSGLNSDRLGALRDARSSLFTHVKRIEGLVKTKFPWAQVHSLMESVSSMDLEDMGHMSDSFGSWPWQCDAGNLLWCSRPRVYWVTWDLQEQEGAELDPPTPVGAGHLVLRGFQHMDDVLREGWVKVDPHRPFPTFTTSRPRSVPGRKPAGIHQCTMEEIDRWIADKHRFPPYQYANRNCVINRSGVLRLPCIEEKEYMLGFPVGYTSMCAGKSDRKGEGYQDLRHTLIGNTWAVPVVAWLLSQLLQPLGLGKCFSPSSSPRT